MYFWSGNAHATATPRRWAHAVSTAFNILQEYVLPPPIMYLLNQVTYIPVSGHLVDFPGAGAGDELAGRAHGADGVQDSAGRVCLEEPELWE